MDIQTISTATRSALPETQAARSPSATESAAKTSATKPVDQPAASDAQLRTAVAAANAFIKPINNSVEFNMDTDAGKMVVKVMDTATKEVIRQIPSEEMIAIAKTLDQIQGLLIKQKA